MAVLRFRKMPIYPWLCWLVVALFYFLQYGLLAIPSVLSQQLRTSLMLDVADVGILYSAFLYTYVVMQIPVGMLFDRFRSRNLLFTASILLAFGCLIFAVSDNLYVAIIGRMIMGIGGSFAFVGALYLGRTWFPIVIFPLIVGLTEAMSGLSEISLIPFIAYLSKLQHWRIILVELSMVIIVLTVLIFFTVRDRRRVATKERSFDFRGALKLILGSSVMWLMSLYIGFTFVFVMSIANMWGAPLLGFYYHIATWEAAVETGMIMLGFTAGCFLIGWVARYVSDRSLILACSVVHFSVLMSFWYFDMDLITAGMALFVIGFVSGSVVVVFDLAKKIVPTSSYGVASGFLNMFFGGLGILVSLLIGYIFGTTKDVFLAFVPTLVCSFIALVIAIILKVIKLEPLLKQQSNPPLPSGEG